ncbi:MAG: Mu-like prophage major head subunit gpT family protein [Methylotetracoccus sp.]
MAYETLSSRAIIGSFYARLEAEFGASWISRLGMKFTSDQDVETYPWLGQSPAMREWIGGRNAKGFNDNSIEIRNKHFEATLEVEVKDLRRDKSGQIMVRINELADRANAHWASLLSTLIANGASTLCYDGQYFFDTDHQEGSSPSQSNKIDVDISALPAQVHGAVTAPSVEEMQQAILKAVTQICSLQDDQGEPMNELARNFLVMVPPAFHFTAVNALAMAQASGPTAQSVLNGFSIEAVSNARLGAWTDKFAVFRTDGSVKPFVLQEETGVMLKAKAEGSEFEFDNDAHQYGIDTWRNVGYGYWQHACLATLI